jgi:hypothetical protein
LGAILGDGRRWTAEGYYIVLMGCVSAGSPNIPKGYPLPRAHISRVSVMPHGQLRNSVTLLPVRVTPDEMRIRCTLMSSDYTSDYCLIILSNNLNTYSSPILDALPGTASAAGYAYELSGNKPCPGKVAWPRRIFSLVNGRLNGRQALDTFSASSPNHNISTNATIQSDNPIRPCSSQPATLILDHTLTRLSFFFFFIVRSIPLAFH